MAEEKKIEIFTSSNGEVTVEVKLGHETMWLTQDQISQLFEKERSVITKHIRNILKEGELDDSVCAKFAHTGSDGKKYQTNHYGLDMILSIGYRVNSKRGVEFRKWSNGVLKDYLIKGYSLNQRQLEQKSIIELQQSLELLSSTLINRKLVSTEGEEILSLIRNYSKTWNILIKYDEDRLDAPKFIENAEPITYLEAKKAIDLIKEELIIKKEASELFGNEKSKELEGIIGNIYQTFDGSELYPCLASKAASLLYFIIKDHPFNDGNKRIGSLLFLLLLKKNRNLIENIPTPEGLTSIALLIAESSPDQKELIVKLVINLISANE